MPRSPNLIKRLRDRILDYGLGGYQDKANTQTGMVPIAKDKFSWTQLSRRRAELPTRHWHEFNYVYDVLSTMPAAENALWQLADDVAHDEDGDACGWSICAMVEALDDSEEAKKDAKELRLQLERIGSDFEERTGAGYKTKHFAHEFLACGDCFGEIVISMDVSSGIGRIEAIKQLPTWQIHVNADEKGTVQSYEQQIYSGDRNPNKWTIPQQIIHWKYRAKDYFKYGESAFAPLRGRFEQFKLLELDFLVAVHTRAVSPEVHKLGRPGGRDSIGPEGVARYKQRMSDDPADITRRYVVETDKVNIEFPKTGDADSIRALFNAHRDLENRFVEALGVSGHISGNPEDIAGRHLSNSLDVKHARKVSSIRGDFTHYFMPAVKLEYALNGIDIQNPEKYGVKRITIHMSWPDQSESRTQKAKRVVLEALSGFQSFDGAVKQLGNRDSIGLAEAILDDRKRGLLPPQEKEPEDISNNNEMGPGVPTSGEDENQKQVKNSVKLKKLLKFLEEIDAD